MSHQLQISGLHWNPEEVGSNTSKEIDQEQNRELPSEREGKHAKSRTLLPPWPLFRLLPEAVSRFRVGLLTASDPIKKNPSQVCQLLEV